MEPARKPVRIGFLVPPGNPTVEIEMIALAPPNVSVHFTRLTAHGAVGAHEGLEERSRMQAAHMARSEEHTSELQSQSNLVCRLLLEKKNKKNIRKETSCD